MNRDQIKFKLMYGTAWKEENTTELVTQALQVGFTAIDTANQRKHYHEEGVGNAFELFFREGGKRENLFLQSKFTYRRGQDHRLPYDEFAPLYQQVEQSFVSSLEHLRTNYLDSFLLHGPYDFYGALSKEDFQVWQSMEGIHQSGKVKHLGVSNVRLIHLKEIWSQSRVKPTFVQNRCYANTKWDFEVREFCRENGIVYQGFSLLTANRKELSSPVIEQIVSKHQCTIPQLIFNFSWKKGIVPLTGTTNLMHMKQDLDSLQFNFSEEELDVVESVGV